MSSMFPTAKLTTAVTSYKASSSGSTTTPTLNWEVDSSQNEEDYCGGFKRVRYWKLTNATDGYVVQKVTRQFVELKQFDWSLNSGKGDWQDMSPAGIDAYTGNTYAYVNNLVYWEAWEVESGNIKGGYGDAFSLSRILPTETEYASNKFNPKDYPRYTTKGAYTITGEAAYYPGLTSAKLGFSVLTDHPANGLLGSDSDPGLSPVYTATTYWATCAWDTAVNTPGKCYSKVKQSGTSG